MGKKPQDHRSKGTKQDSGNGSKGTGAADDQAVDLNDDGGSDDSSQDDEDDLDDEDEDEDDEDEDDEQDSIADQIQAGIAAALPTISKNFQSEMDRRINSALGKDRSKNPPKGKEKSDSEDEKQAPTADVRGARLAFREYLPESIKLFSPEERTLAVEFGQAQIKSRALVGFEDEDQVGREVAESTAKFLNSARKLYSARTKRVLQKQGALIEQPSGPAPHNKGTGPSAENAIEAAKKKDRELFPERYKD